MMRYLTDRQLEDIPALAALDDDGRAMVLADAERVYGRIDRDPYVDDGELRRWAETEGIGPDRVNAALGVLEQTERVVAFEDAAPGGRVPVMGGGG